MLSRVETNPPASFHKDHPLMDLFPRDSRNITMKLDLSLKYDSFELVVKEKYLRGKMYMILGYAYNRLLPIWAEVGGDEEFLDIIDYMKYST